VYLNQSLAAFADSGIRLIKAQSRHTWASWHVQQGTPLHALQELGGWESSEMVRRYAHFSADHLAPYADRLCALRVVDDSCHGTNSAHPAKEKGAGAANPLN
jgi:beta-glucosidase/6-phospho-beta-glucosidase/beta-galactosidase